MDLLRTCWIEPLRKSPRRTAFGFFTHGTDPPLYVLLILHRLSLQPSSPTRLPQPFGCRSSRSNGFSSWPFLAHPGHTAFTALPRYYSGPPTADWASLAFSLALIGSLTAVPPADPFSSPEVTSLFFRIVPPAITLPWWANENAFAYEGRLDLSHLWPTGSSSESPPRLRPDVSPHALRIPDRSGHPALQIP